jgi:hypothetical protein
MNLNRRNVLSLSAIAALTLPLLPGGAMSQQKSLKEQLVGTWMLVSFERTANGAKQPVANPKGILMFDAGGRYVMAGERGDRPKFKSAGQPTTDELATATLDFFAANFGTWSVSEADKTLTQRYDGALRPNNEGTDVMTTVSLTGDELKLTSVNPLATGVRIDQTFRRAK